MKSPFYSFHQCVPLKEIKLITLTQGLITSCYHIPEIPFHAYKLGRDPCRFIYLFIFNILIQK